jgi:hypothetical protein
MITSLSALLLFPFIVWQADGLPLLDTSVGVAKPLL